MKNEQWRQCLMTFPSLLDSHLFNWCWNPVDYLLPDVALEMDLMYGLLSMLVWSIISHRFFYLLFYFNSTMWYFFLFLIIGSLLLFGLLNFSLLIWYLVHFIFGSRDFFYSWRRDREKNRAGRTRKWKRDQRAGRNKRRRKIRDERW